MSVSNNAEIKDIVENPLGTPDWDDTDPLQTVEHIRLPFCNVTLAEDIWNPKEFKASNRLVRTNTLALRGGGSSDMMTLFTGTSDEQKDYVIGLVTTSVVLIAFFLFWCICILVMKFTGFRRVGFLCGRFIRHKAPPKTKSIDDKSRMVEDEEEREIAIAKTDDETAEPNSSHLVNKISGSFSGDLQSRSVEPVKVEIDEPAGTTNTFRPTHDSRELHDEPQSHHLAVADPPEEDASDEYKAWYKLCQRQQVRLFRTRVALVISCLCISVSGCLFCYYGDKYISQSFDSVKDGFRRVQDLCSSGIILIDNLAIRQNRAENATVGTLSTVNGACPKVRQRICQSTKPKVENCNFTDIPFVEESFEKVFTTVYTTKTYIFDALASVREDLQEIYNDLDDYVDKTTRLEPVFWVSFGFTVALIVCCLVIIYGIYLAHRGKMNRARDCVRHRIVLPLFCILVFFAFVFAAGFIIASVAASDFCINGPDSKVSYLLDKAAGDEKTNLIYLFAKYYINQCRNDLAPVDIEEESNILVSLLEDLKKFSEDVSSIDTTQWNAQCGSNLAVLNDFSTLTQNVMCLLTLTLQDLNRFMWCRQWSPIYTSFMHETMCFNVQEGLGWVASTMFVIVLFSFVVLLLRAGAFDVEDEETYLHNVRKCRVFTYRLFCCLYCRKQEDTEEDDEDEEEYPIADKSTENQPDPVSSDTDDRSGPVVA